MNIALFLPEIALIILLIVAIFIDVVNSRRPSVTKHGTILMLGTASLLGFAATLFLLIMQPAGLGGGLLINDGLSHFFKVVVLAGSAIAVIMTFSSAELQTTSNSPGEFFILLIGMTLGMFLLASATNLLMIYLAFETMSLCSYILAGYTKEVRRASEASLKYVIYGSLASGLMIYGISLLFGLTGSLELAALADAAVQPGNTLAFGCGVVLVFAGIAYKISAVPFHFWTPDVYEGAPVVTTALLSVVSKAAGFAVLMRFGWAVFASDSVPAGGLDWAYLIAVVAVLTMTLGNLIAVWQTNLKRLLAYSSIAHCGYMLMGVMVGNTASYEGVMFYFVTYLLMNFGAFIIVQLIANRLNSEELDNYNGLAYRNPFVAAALTIFLLSLMGMPPFAGFIAKLYLFTPVLEAGYVGIAVIGVLNSVVSVFYYVKVIRNMYLRESDNPQEPLRIERRRVALVYCFAVPVVLLIINFQPVLEWIQTIMING